MTHFAAADVVDFGKKDHVGEYVDGMMRLVPRKCVADCSCVTPAASPHLTPRGPKTSTTQRRFLIEITIGMVSESLARRVFSTLEGGEGNFFDYLSDKVSWTFTGPDGPNAGTLIGGGQLLAKSWLPFGEKLETALTVKAKNILVSGDWVIG
jgi:hypothetical protein